MAILSSVFPHLILFSLFLSLSFFSDRSTKKSDFTLNLVLAVSFLVFESYVVFGTSANDFGKLLTAFMAYCTGNALLNFANEKCSFANKAIFFLMCALAIAYAWEYSTWYQLVWVMGGVFFPLIAAFSVEKFFLQTSS